MTPLRIVKQGTRSSDRVAMLVLVAAGTVFGGVFCGGGLSYKVDDAALDAVPV